MCSLGNIDGMAPAIHASAAPVALVPLDADLLSLATGVSPAILAALSIIGVTTVRALRTFYSHAAAPSISGSSLLDALKVADPTIIADGLAGIANKVCMPVDKS